MEHHAVFSFYYCWKAFVLDINLSIEEAFLFILLHLFVNNYTKIIYAYRVYQLLGESGTYYGVRFGKNIPWVTEFPFGYISDPQYIGSIMSLVACLSWVPFQYILLWVLGYVLMIRVESRENPATRAKVQS